MEVNRNACKGMVVVVIFFSLSLIPHYTQADYQTNLSFSGYIQSGTGDLDIGSWSVPTVYDWDSDGAKDLLVGRSYNGIGYVSYYRNIGTDVSPVFNGYTDIQECKDYCTNPGG